MSLYPRCNSQAQIVATDVVSQIKVCDQPAYINLLLQKLARRRMLTEIPLSQYKYRRINFRKDLSTIMSCPI